MEQPLRAVQEEADREAAERGRREADETRREGGLDQGLPIGGGYRVGGSVDRDEPRVEMRVSKEWEPPQ